jgi:Activator of Hsp90 ATPase homolog 1-like protein
MVSRELGFPERYSTLRYTKIVPLERIDYLHNVSDKDGNAIDPTSIGMPKDFTQNLLNAVTLRDLGHGKTEMTLTEHGWPVRKVMEMSKIGMEQCIKKMARAMRQHT